MGHRTFEHVVIQDYGRIGTGPTPTIVLYGSFVPFTVPTPKDPRFYMTHSLGRPRAM